MTRFLYVVVWLSLIEHEGGGKNNKKNYPSRGLNMVVTRTLENYCITILPGN